MTPSRKPLFHILLVEDNPDDILLTKMAVEESRFNVELHVAEDGEEALKFLENKEMYQDAPKPHLILLDLNLPRKSGLEILKRIKRSDRLKDIPVVVLTTSVYEEDVRQSYKYHANCYISKPVDLENFLSVVRFIEHFYFGVVTLPPGE
jgi:CheY-like chemotaxis protein